MQNSAVCLRGINYEVYEVIIKPSEILIKSLSAFDSKAEKNSVDSFAADWLDAESYQKENNLDNK